MDIDIKETLNAMILSRIGYYNLTGLHELYAQAGSATQIIEASGDIKQLRATGNGLRANCNGIWIMVSNRLP